MAQTAKLTWIGRGLSLLAAIPFLIGSCMKLFSVKVLDDGLKHVGINHALVFSLGILELSCVVIYLIPQTCVLGAILLTGFMGGAIATHVRIGEPVYFQICLGVLIWFGVYLRKENLRKLIPFSNK